MHRIFIIIFIIILIPLKFFAQDVFTIHTSRDKTTLLAVEKIRNKYFVFFHDSTFFDKRIKCKVFDKANPLEIKEFYITPKLYTFQDELKIGVISEKLLFLTFTDFRNDFRGDIYCQLIDENGILFDSAGIPVCVASGYQRNQSISIDEDKNIFIAWEDTRNDSTSDIFVQKMDLFGKTLWEKNGIPVSNIEGREILPQVVSDNSGGCFVSWIDGILSINKLYIQFIDSSGIKKFGQYGIYISNPEESVTGSFLKFDQKNELTIIYSAAKNFSKIYFQKISKKGSKRLRAFGNELCTVKESQKILSIDKLPNNDLAILFSLEDENGLQSSFIQVITQGERLKFKTPIRVHNKCNYYQKPVMKIDQKGFFIYWTCEHTNAAISLFIQTISFKGEILTLDGLKLNDEPLNPESIFYLSLDNPIECIVSNFENKNGLYFLYFDISNHGNLSIKDFEIMSYDGLIKLSWSVINQKPGTKISLQKAIDGINYSTIFDTILTTKSTFNKMTFDDRALESKDIFYKLFCIDSDGNEIVEERSLYAEIPEGFFLYQNVPNPFDKSTKISFKLPKKSRVVIKLYDSKLTEIAVLINEVKEPGTHEFEFVPFNFMESGVYFYKITASGFYDVKKMIYSK